MWQNNLHLRDEKGVRELITALKVQIATLSMPLKGENRDRKKKKDKKKKDWRVKSYLYLAA